MTKITKKSKVSTVTAIDEKIADLATDLARIVRLWKRTYSDGDVRFLLTEITFYNFERKLPNQVELTKPELTELLVQAFEYLKNPKLVKDMSDLKMPTEMKQ